MIYGFITDFIIKQLNTHEFADFERRFDKSAHECPVVFS
jgi:hypothetical protein